MGTNGAGCTVIEPSPPVHFSAFQGVLLTRQRGVDGGEMGDWRGNVKGNGGLQVLCSFDAGLLRTPVWPEI